MGKHRHEHFRPGWAVLRIDGYDSPGIPKEQHVTVKEIWLSEEQADAEVARLNEINGDKSYRYFSFWVKVEREAGSA